MWDIQGLLRCRTSYNQAVHMLHTGLIRQRTFDWFCLFSDWAAPRFSGTAGFKQERFWNRCGKDAYYRRIERIKRLHDNVACGIVKINDAR